MNRDNPARDRLLLSHTEDHGRQRRTPAGTGELPSMPDYETYRENRDESLYEDTAIHHCVGCHRYYVRVPDEPADEFYCSTCLDRPAWDQFTELYSDLGGG